MYKMIFRFVLKLEIGWVEVETGRQSSQSVITRTITITMITLEPDHVIALTE
jgi:hypothetical protein